MATFETSKQAVLDRINTLASSSSTTAEDSIYLAKALREAAADIAFVWRGPWTSTYTYVLGDVVQHDGNAYICINAHVAAVTFDSASGSWQTMVVGGAQWFTGNTVPANSSGEDGDWFFNSADEKIHNRQSGTWVSIADLGGSIWTSSAGVGTGGEDGDFHFNETTQELSKRSSGTWTVLADLTPSSMTNAEVKTAYEANADTNEFSDAEQTKLAGIASGADNVGTGTAGQVLKTNSGATGIEWGTDEGGKIKKVTFVENSTRYALSDASTSTIMTFNFTVDNAGADIYISGGMVGRGNHSDVCGMFCSMDSGNPSSDGPAFKGVQWANAHSTGTHGTYQYNQKWSGLSVGSHTISLGWKHRDGGSGKPFSDAWNPDNTNDGRRHQTSTTLTITEVL